MKWTALAALLSAVAALGADDQRNLIITSEPPGARVTINGNFRGTTPLSLSFGKWAFDSRKTTVLSKHLSTPINVEISLEGYAPEKASLTEGPLVWRSFNRQNSFTYWVITNAEYTAKLRPIPQVRVLTNADVVELVKAGLSETLVIDKIHASAGAFQTEIADIMALKKAGATDAVISAMIQKSP